MINPLTTVKRHNQLVLGLSTASKGAGFNWKHLVFLSLDTK